jgi:DNA-binding NtrC family response regulator
MKPIKAEGSSTLQAPVAPKISVLIVDEDADDLGSCSSLFEQEGYDVRACSTYADALRWLRSEIFDFIIVSQGSPEFEGRSVLKRANEIDRRLPVLVLARCADVGCYLEAIQLGALDYLEKPLPPQELLQLVKSHLRARASGC